MYYGGIREPTAADTSETEYARSTSTPEPIYNEYSAGPLFSCEAELSQHPGQPFGGRDERYSNKKAARNNAARKAVEWLRAEGLLSEDGPVRKKKVKANSPSGNTNSSPKGATDKSEDPAETESYVHKVIGTFSCPASFFPFHINIFQPSPLLLLMLYYAAETY